MAAWRLERERGCSLRRARSWRKEKGEGRHALAQGHGIFPASVAQPSAESLHDAQACSGSGGKLRLGTSVADGHGDRRGTAGGLMAWWHPRPEGVVSGSGSRFLDPEDTAYRWKEMARGATGDAGKDALRERHIQRCA